MTITSQTGLSLFSTVNTSYRPLWHLALTRQKQNASSAVFWLRPNATCAVCTVLSQCSILVRSGWATSHPIFSGQWLPWAWFCSNLLCFNLSFCSWFCLPLVLFLNLHLLPSVLALISPTSCSILNFCFVSMCYFALISSLDGVFNSQFSSTIRYSSPTISGLCSVSCAVFISMSIKPHKLKYL